MLDFVLIISRKILLENDKNFNFPNHTSQHVKVRKNPNPVHFNTHKRYLQINKLLASSLEIQTQKKMRIFLIK